ncbi:MAG TPA: HEAT repeat domain-containing protein [Candidatus Limnocylindria bacterium]|nr:HEAT repeat domain-containing protein [Candidatus Limnocylindria bacterium]
MADQTDARTPLPRRVRTMLDPDRRFVSEQVARDLSVRDVEALKAVVRDRSGRPESASLSRAIGALSVRDPSAETAELLATFGRDRSEDPVDRAAAAAGLRLIPLPEARRGLTRLVTAPDYIVRVEALKAAGCIGDESMLRTLERLDRRPEGGEERQRAFAMALITHRLGVSGDHIPFQPGVARRAGKDADLIDLSLRPVRSKTIAGERERLRGSDYSIPLSDRVGFALSAGKARWTVFVNADLADGGGVFARSSRIFERPWITALLARIDDRTKTSAVQYIVLSDPDEAGARIMVIRTDGEPFYSGNLTRPKGMLSFVVRDIARKATAPTNVRGRLTTRGVEFDVRIPFGSRRDPNTGDTVSTPDASRTR